MRQTSCCRTPDSPAVPFVPCHSGRLSGSHKSSTATPKGQRVFITKDNGDISRWQIFLVPCPACGNNGILENFPYPSSIPRRVHRAPWLHHGLAYGKSSAGSGLWVRRGFPSAAVLGSGEGHGGPVTGSGARPGPRRVLDSFCPAWPGPRPRGIFCLFTSVFLLIIKTCARVET